LLVLWVGAGMVLQGSLTLGQLIAFRILSGYVTQPLLRLSSIWQTVQELRVSFERLADVVDTPQESTEADQRKLPLPPIQGHVRFEKLTFSFGGAGTPAVLRQVDLDVPTGTFVGIVGQSGSGKSTLMKLLPRLYSPQKGRILIDDYDIDKVELYSLRRQIGIVPQDPLLFSGSVADNIALTNPECSSEAIERAARIACAHEFIMQLPAGYSTMVGERGAGLSGGQRQRIAIARTLLSNPKLLVMDEATSALDYDTERRVCNNLRDTLRGCTVFFITHRLSTIRGADRIVLMDQGAIVEQGSHEALMAQRGRYYALSRQQDAGVAA
jgi:ATP-binding cassette, subfamily B, bacterial HlyB/CyaB